MKRNSGLLPVLKRYWNLELFANFGRNSNSTRTQVRERDNQKNLEEMSESANEMSGKDSPNNNNTDKAPLSGAALEDAKNMALLFFMDHLMTKGGQRTIHDLSCQFGARGFSEDMREAVGSTQEGLQAFLGQFPSLFQLDGDEIRINAYGAGQGDGGGQATGVSDASKQRDYEREAIDFFIVKLKKFGPELQIKSLLGHRSQAAPEVRLISGRHLKDFADFLRSQPDFFIVSGDRVRLAQMPEPDDPNALLDEHGQPLEGTRAKDTAVEYLKQQIELNEELPIPLDQMYQKFCERFPHAVRQEVATNPKELLQFLKLNRSVFFIRSNKVSLVRLKPEDERQGETGPDMNRLSILNGTSGSAEHSGSEATSGTEDNQRPVIIVVKALKPAQIALNDLLNEDITIDNQPVLAVDCKFVSLGPSTPEFLSLVVIGTARSRLIVFDIAHSDTILMESGLRQILESPDVVKVMHDCRSTVQTLKQRYAIQVCNVFDTQVAHTVIHHKRHDRMLHEIRPISFQNMQRLYYPDSTLPNQETVAKRAEMNWAHRPITDDCLQHICEQTLHLLPQIYNSVRSALPAEALELFVQLCAARLYAQNNNEMMPIALQKPLVVPGQSLNNMRRPGGTSSNNIPPAAYVPPMMAQNGSHQMKAQPASKCCQCRCHSGVEQNNNTANHGKVDSSTQTLSTGEITIHKIHYG